MPVKVDETLPAVEQLKKENIFIMGENRASTQDIRPLRIAVLNLMPLKIMAETDLLRLLSNTPLQIELDLVDTGVHDSRNTPEEHIAAFYKTFDEIEHNYYDGFIVTGAPVEKLKYEDVDYWTRLTEIFDWARTHATSTLYICWAALAGLYHFYGIDKMLLKEKISGVFKHRSLDPLNPLLRGFDDMFYVPHSRYATIDPVEIKRKEGLVILSDSEESGVYIVMGKEGREFFITGHSEYSPMTLDYEYHRDLDKGINPKIPCNYYPNDNPNNKPEVKWRSHANLLFSNWLNYYVYQQTPFNLSELALIK